MKRIWFNHWFSAAYNIITMLKNAEPDYFVIGTNENELSVVSLACDEWYTEPAVNGDTYVDFCLAFCKEHKVDVFLPRREMLSISKRIGEFNDIGVRVMVEDYEIASILNHKDRAYEFLSQKGISTIPPHYTVTTINDFENAYDNLASRFDKVCIKFVHDEGGKSFRLIDNNRKGYSALFKKQNTRMTYDAVHEALSERDKFSPLMVMPYLPGDEISADCLDTHKGLIVLPRIKGSTRIERIEFDDDVITKVVEIYDVIKLQWPCNIQFKYLDGVPYFLEVNTRMSGGVQMACAASGVNIPDIAINKLLGVEKDWAINRKEQYISQVGIPLVL